MLPWALILISIPVLFTYPQVINHESFFFWLQNSNIAQEVNINLLNVYNYLGEVSPFAMLLIYIVCCYIGRLQYMKVLTLPLPQSSA